MKKQIKFKSPKKYDFGGDLLKTVGNLFETAMLAPINGILGTNLDFYKPKNIQSSALKKFDEISNPIINGVGKVGGQLAMKALSAGAFQKGGYVNGKYYADGKVFESAQDYVSWKYSMGASNKQDAFSQVMSVPQKTAMALMGGGYNLPSSKLTTIARTQGGNDMPEFYKIATDMVLDPLNAVWGTPQKTLDGYRLATSAKVLNAAKKADNVNDVVSLDLTKKTQKATRRFQKGGYVNKKVILDGKPIMAWVDESTGKMSLTNPVTPEGMLKNNTFHEFSGDTGSSIEPTQQSAQPQSKSYKYRGIEYKKFDDGNYYWKSEKTGSWIKAKNFNDDYVKKYFEKTAKKINKIVNSKDAPQEIPVQEEFTEEELEKYKNDPQNMRETFQFGVNSSVINYDEIPYTMNKQRWGDFQHGLQFDTKPKPYNQPYRRNRLGVNRLLTSLDGTPFGMSKQEWEDIKKSGRKYQQGNEVQTEDMIPYNTEHIDKISENLIQFDGPNHDQGGIKTPAGEFDKQETVLKKGVAGNEVPFAFSDNLKISKETADYSGFPKFFEGKTIAEASKWIESKYASKYNDDSVKRKTKQMMKENLFNKLMEVNKIESAKHREENGIQGKEDLTFQELNQFQLGEEVPNYKIPNPDFTYVLPDYRIPNPDFTYVPVNEKGSKINYQLPFNSFQLPKTFTPLEIPKPKIEENKSKGFLSGLSTEEKIGLGANLVGTLGQLPSLLKKENIATQHNPYGTEFLSNMNNKVDLSTINDKMNSNFNNVLYGTGDRSHNVKRGLINSLYGEHVSKLQDLDLKSQELNNQFRTQLGAAYNNIGQQNVQAKNMKEDLQTRTNANRNDALRELLGNTTQQISDFAFDRDFANKTINEGIKLMSYVSTDFKLDANTASEFRALLNTPDGKVLKSKIEAGEFKDSLPLLIEEIRKIDKNLAEKLSE